MKKTISNLLFFTFVIFGISSCTKEECSDSNDAQENVEVKIRRISKDEVPFGVQPLKVNSQAEFDRVVNEMKQLKSKVVITDEHSQKVSGGITRVKSRSEGESVGSKSVRGYLSNDKTILIFLLWNKIGGNIQINSTNEHTWPFSTWTQEAGGANWIGRESIQYTVIGTVKTFLITSNGGWFELSRTSHTVTGTTQI